MTNYLFKEGAYPFCWYSKSTLLWRFLHNSRRTAT